MKAKATLHFLWTCFLTRDSWVLIQMMISLLLWSCANFCSLRFQWCQVTSSCQSLLIDVMPRPPRIRKILWNTSLLQKGKWEMDYLPFEHLPSLIRQTYKVCGRFSTFILERLRVKVHTVLEMHHGFYAVFIKLKLDVQPPRSPLCIWRINLFITHMFMGRQSSEGKIL